jgi:uncharacterized RDD family membrane protein YckC
MEPTPVNTAADAVSDPFAKAEPAIEVAEPVGGAAPGFGAAPVAPSEHAAVAVPAQAPVAAPYGMTAPAHTVPYELRVGAGARFGAYLLNGLLMVVTLGIGWLVWAMITWANDAANPGQKLMGLTIVNKNTGARLTWGGMFARNFLLGGLVMGVLSTITLTVVAWINLLKVFGGERQNLVDSMAGTVVVRATA